MLLLKRVLQCCCLFILGCIKPLSAQLPKDNSIFWEITPKGGGKSSYLYGTMHVSKKVAFRLPDKFYDAVKNADVVALESNPEKWNEELEKSEDIQTLYDLTGIGLSSTLNYGRSYYSAIYGLTPLTNATIKTELGYEPRSANELLFRSYGLQKNFEEDTYLDLYIYKTGRKFGKPIASLEDVVWSMISVVKASYSKENRKSKKVYSGNMNTDLEDAYREQNLVKLDSIQRASSPSDAYLQGLLYTRNDTMFKNMEVMIKNGKSVFAAVGAAHLGGEKGLLLKFIQAGYQVKAIKDASQLDPSSKILALDSVYLPVTFSTQHSLDSTLSFAVPSYTSRSNTMGKVEYLSTDMVNGVYYYVGRLNTYASLAGLSNKMIEQKFDSLLFENVKGTILEKNKSTCQGYPCLNVINKTKDGKLHKQKIIITPIEILFCKVVGKEGYFKRFPSDTFLNSIQIKYKKNIETFSLPDVSVNMPLSTSDNPFPKIAYNAPNLLVQGVDDQGNYYQMLRNYTVRQFEHEEDSFHVNMAAFFMLRSQNLKLLEQKNGLFKGLPSLDIIAKNDLGKKVFIRILERASNLYYLVACTENKEKAEQFLNSFEVHNNIVLNTRVYEDTANEFSFRTNLKPLGGELSEALFSQGTADEGVGKRKSLFMSVYGDYSLGYQFTMNLFELNKYECYPSIDSFWNAYYDEIQGKYSFDEKLTVQKKHWSANNQYYFQVQATDTNTQNKSIYLAVTSGNKLMEMSSFYDSTQRSYRYIDTAFQTLKFTKPKPSTLLVSKMDTFLSHMVSKDSAIKEYFSNNKDYLRLLDQDESKLIALLDTSETLRKRDDIYSSLLYEMHYFKKPSTFNFIRKLYKQNEENSSRQIDLLTLLAYMNDSTSTLLFKDLLMDSPPLDFSDDNDPLTHYFDTLSLSRLLMPELLDLTDIDDYKYNVIYLTNELYKEKKIDSALYASKVNYFTLKGKEEIRRKTSQKSSIEQVTEEAEEENEEDKKSDKWSMIGNYFVLQDEKEVFQSDINFGDFYLIKTFASLLRPYDQREHVKEFFKKIDSTNNKDLKFDFAMLNAEKNKPFNKEIIAEYAALPKYRYSIMHSFYFNDIWKKLPFQVKDQLEVAKFRIMQTADLSSTDELVFVDKVWVNSSKDKGFIYLFKHKKQKDEDYLYDFTGLFDRDEKKLLPARGITRCNIDIEKKTLSEVKEQLYNQFRVLNRTYVTPDQMIFKKDGEDSNLLQMLQNYGGED